MPAMITGSKRRRADEPGEDAKRASMIALIAALGAGIVVSLALMAQSAPASARASAEIDEHHFESDDD